ncbi:hypothetical protein BOX15_Mlig032778g2 [Macrostomum lignano]|uniref:SCA7 domain-containing protein n=3 Tax=Macrostomum lignano TaxID=282301 RepID=A0A267DNB6_9PLAT|nr:hypothetical protein BOX15_Mlig032778g2 [Macrostomum lignano]
MADWSSWLQGEVSAIGQAQRSGQLRCPSNPEPSSPDVPLLQSDLMPLLSQTPLSRDFVAHDCRLCSLRFPSLITLLRHLDSAHSKGRRKVRGKRDATAAAAAAAAAAAMMADSPTLTQAALLSTSPLMLTSPPSTPSRAGGAAAGHLASALQGGTTAPTSVASATTAVEDEDDEQEDAEVAEDDEEAADDDEDAEVGNGRGSSSGGIWASPMAAEDSQTPRLPGLLEEAPVSVSLEPEEDAVPVVRIREEDESASAVAAGAAALVSLASSGYQQHRHGQQGGAATPTTAVAMSPLGGVASSQPLMHQPSHTSSNSGQSGGTKTRILPLRDRAFDPDNHCGVVTDSGQRCVRSLTCKKHSLRDRRAVPGRTRPFDALLQASRSLKSGQPPAVAPPGAPVSAAAGPLPAVSSSPQLLNHQHQQTQPALQMFFRQQPVVLIPTATALCSSAASSSSSPPPPANPEAYSSDEDFLEFPTPAPTPVPLPTDQQQPAEAVAGAQFRCLGAPQPLLLIRRGGGRAASAATSAAGCSTADGGAGSGLALLGWARRRTLAPMSGIGAHCRARLAQHRVAMQAQLPQQQQRQHHHHSLMQHQHHLNQQSLLQQQLAAPVVLGSNPQLSASAIVKQQQLAHQAKHR